MFRIVILICCVCLFCLNAEAQLSYCDYMFTCRAQLTVGAPGGSCDVDYTYEFCPDYPWWLYPPNQRYGGFHSGGVQCRETPDDCQVSSCECSCTPGPPNDPHGGSSYSSFTTSYVTCEDRVV